MEFNNIFDINMVNVMKELEDRVANDTKYEQIIGKTIYEPNIQEGIYRAITTDASYEKNVKTDYGISERIAITFLLFKTMDNNEYEKINLNRYYYKSKSMNSKYYMNLSELLQHSPFEGFQLKELIGIDCEIKIVHKKTEKGTRAEFETIKRLDSSCCLNKITL